jgi:GNAT superfamily N-acetyltransferase
VLGGAADPLGCGASARRCCEDPPVTEWLPEGLTARRPRADDHGRVLAVMDDWWGGLGGAAGSRERALLLPRLFFQHFTDTSRLVEAADGRLAAFLIGFLSASEPGTAFVHFVGVDPALRRTGIAGALYAGFFRQATERGAHTAKCVTSPGNTTSVAFHTRLGFQVDPSAVVDNGVPVQQDYDGPGLHRVTFTRRLTSPPQHLPT